MRNLRAEGGFHGLRRGGQQRGVEDARQDRVHTDEITAEVARDGERHTDDAALGGGVGSLADLAVFGSNRSGVDDRAAFAVDRVERQHAGGGFRDAAEGADEVDLDDQVELIEREVFRLPGFLVAAGGLDRIAGAGAVDQDPLLADGGAGFGETGIDRGFVGHVDVTENAAEFLGEGFAFFGVEVEQGDLDAVRGQFAGGCGPEAGSATRDDGGDVRVQFHGQLPSFDVDRVIGYDRTAL